jgi:pimeloyl-ACP methyl ester carboxylesterase
VTARTPIEIGVDGLVLRGEHCAGTSLFAVLVHDQGEDLDGWRDVPEQLSEHGASVIAFDLRGHGGSEGPPAPGDAALDIEAAVAVAREAGAQAVVVVASGASASAALNRSTADAVIAITPTPTSEAPSPGRPHARLVVATADQASEDVVNALQAEPGRRTLVARVPVDQAGLAVLEGAWGTNVASYIVAFVRRIGLELAARRHAEVVQTLREDS